MDPKEALQKAWMCAQGQADDSFTWDEAHVALAITVVEVSLHEARKAADSISDPYERIACYLKLAMRTGEEQDLRKVFKIMDPALTRSEEQDIRTLLEAHAAFEREDIPQAANLFAQLQSPSLIEATLSFLNGKIDLRDPAYIEDSLEWIGCLILKEWLWWDQRARDLLRAKTLLAYTISIRTDTDTSPETLMAYLCEVAEAGNPDIAIIAAEKAFGHLVRDVQTPFFWAVVAGNTLHSPFDPAFGEHIADTAEIMEGAGDTILVGTHYQALAYARLYVALSLKEHS